MVGFSSFKSRSRFCTLSKVLNHEFPLKFWLSAIPKVLHFGLAPWTSVWQDCQNVTIVSALSSHCASDPNFFILALLFKFESWFCVWKYGLDLSQKFEFGECSLSFRNGVLLQFAFASLWYSRKLQVTNWGGTIIATVDLLLPNSLLLQQFHSKNRQVLVISKTSSWNCALFLN